MQKQPVSPLPSWVPEEASRYLDHTEAGQSIRQLARAAGCHPSTVLRQVRRIETRRDDPLVDCALQSLAARHYGSAAAAEAAGRQGFDAPKGAEATFEQELSRILRGLCHSGAVLALAEGMDKAVVVREAEGEAAQKTVVDRHIAEALALRDWISCACPGRLSRYHITASGRSALSAMMAAAENRAQKTADGFGEAGQPFAAQGLQDKANSKRPRRVRYGLAESPLDTLARLHDRDGNPFLTADLVAAGERLREDFELAQIGNHLELGRNQFNTEHCGASQMTNPVEAAKRRAAGALNHLGAGLSDIALRCCCHLLGLEAAERQLGWSARSGKVVLRIALQQLKAHYDGLSGSDNLIG
ncbi:MAG: helix-turn-helix domain-containing protein [Rhodobacteraceae bacterium]|nr:helix-turn-helix domain-containing protein [Paracoccaceae bacterium]